VNRGPQRRLREVLTRAQGQLWSARNAEGHWSGELSSSALSTATAVCALSTLARHSNPEPRLDDLISRGLEWLAGHANADGGWGDTVLSRSNISTTALGWAAFGSVPGADAAFRPVVDRAARWLEQQAGGLDPDRLSAAIIRRYGQDRTFSVPILTMCAIAGRLGSVREAWRRVLPLPFELAACPHSWFAALGLPVVSYALPALIAMGQARHFHRPSPNPIARFTRQLARGRTLRLLREIQPTSGGYLEATPLTSFVVMSLAASGQAEHPVVQSGRKFLAASARPDGSWAIDSNLATWLTTLAVKALARDPNYEMPDADRGLIRSWLVRQQFRSEHPYTQARPGGWAWTDLPGGVPDTDDTAGALLALHHLGPDPDTEHAARLGLEWLLQIQNRDGGIPTFCRGWGKLPFDRSSPDLTAHALRAWTAWMGRMSGPLQSSLQRAVERAARYLASSQGPDGWVPLWFGNQFAPAEANLTYGNARVLEALNPDVARFMPDFNLHQGRAVDYLLRAQHRNGAWGGSVDVPSSIEETALAVEALAGLLLHGPLQTVRDPKLVMEAVRRGTNCLVARVEDGGWTVPSPIGFYFAKLWYYERLYPLIFTVGALGQVAELDEV
jgi:squalene-hopene/tetraprenyl-beta-curcumene cyclase